METGNIHVYRLPVGGKHVIRILFVDDEKALCELTKRFLEEQNGGFRVVTALSVDEALRKLMIVEFDVVVSDYKMPGKDGLEFLTELRDLGSKVPFIIFTGKGQEEVAAEAFRKGADGYVMKGREPASQFLELANWIRQVVARRGAEEALRETEEKYRTLVELVQDGIIMTKGLERTITFANRRMGEMLGYTAEELVWKNYIDLVHPDEREEALQAMESDLTSKKGGIYEKHLVKKDGSTIHALILASLTNPKSQFSPALLVIKETTEK